MNTPSSLNKPNAPSTRSTPAAILLRTAAVFGFLGVSLGAFGAHGLADLLTTHGTTAIWGTAVQYHFVHTLALLVLAALAALAGGALGGDGGWRFLGWIGWSWSLGIVVFSGSLYVLSLTGLRWLGAVTPIGGVLFLVGWLLLCFSYRRP